MSVAEGTPPSTVGLTLPSRLLGTGDSNDDGLEFDFFATSDTQRKSAVGAQAKGAKGEAAKSPSSSGSDFRGANSAPSNSSSNSDSTSNSDSNIDGYSNSNSNSNIKFYSNSNSNGYGNGRQKTLSPKRGPVGNTYRKPNMHKEPSYLDFEDFDRPVVPTDLTDEALVQALRHPRDRGVALQIEADMWQYVGGAMQCGALVVGNGSPFTQHFDPMYYPYLQNKFHRLLVYRICDRFSLARVHQDGDGENVPCIKIHLMRKTAPPRMLLINFVNNFPDYFKFDDMHQHLVPMGGHAPAAGNSIYYDGSTGNGKESISSHGSAESTLTSTATSLTSAEGGKINRIMQRPTVGSRKDESGERGTSTTGGHGDRADSPEKPDEEVDEERMLAYEKKKLAIFGEESTSSVEGVSPEQQGGDAATGVTTEGSSLTGTNAMDEEISGDKSIRINRGQEQADPDFQAGRAAGRYGASLRGGRGGSRNGHMGSGRGRGGRGRGVRGADTMNTAMQPGGGYNMHMGYGGGADMVMANPYMGNPQMMYQMMQQYYGGVPPPNLYGMPIPQQPAPAIPMQPPTMQFAMDGSGIVMHPMIPGPGTSPTNASPAVPMGVPVGMDAGMEQLYAGVASVPVLGASPEAAQMGHFPPAQAQAQAQNEG